VNGHLKKSFTNAQSAFLSLLPTLSGAFQAENDASVDTKSTV